MFRAMVHEVSQCPETSSLLLNSHHVYLVDVEPRPGEVAHQLHRHDGVEEGPHGAAVVAPAHARHHHHHHHRELTGLGS